jgi:hypothetical protein
MALKLPPYVHAFRDRHGKTRYYFRRRGFRRAPLPGLPYSSEFMRAYEAAAQTVGVFGSSRSRPGTVAAAVAGYFASSAFASLAESTRKGRRRILERFRDDNGANAIAALTRRDVVAHQRSQGDQKIQGSARPRFSGLDQQGGWFAGPSFVPWTVEGTCRRLAELGCSVSVIASISGHSSLREVARYTAAADQARLARQGIEALTGTPSGKLGGQSGKPRSKALK